MGETTIIGRHKITADGDVTIDGVRFLNDSSTTNGGPSNPTLQVLTGYDHVITNSIFYSQVNGAANGVDDRAISFPVITTGDVEISNNYFTGAFASGFSGGSWGRGIWFDGGGIDVTIEGNTFEYTRTGINLDMSGDSTAAVTGNTFKTAGTGASVGIDLDGATFTDNNYRDVGDEFNFRNLTTDIDFDAEVAVATLTSTGVPATDQVVVLGGEGNDHIRGTAGNDRLDDNAAGATFESSTAVDTDTLEGRAGDDVLVAEFGDDTLNGGGDNDTLLGGAGNDTAVYGVGVSLSNITAVATDTDPITAGTQAGWQVVSAEGTDTLNGIERIDDSDGGITLLVGNGGYATLTDAVAAANADTSGEPITILVAPGTYTGNITIARDNVTLLSTDGTATIAGSGATGQGVITITADNVTIGDDNRGFNVTMDGNQLAGIYLVSGVAGVVIEDNAITATAGKNAILTEGGVSNVDILGNVFNGATGGQIVYINGTASVGLASTNVDVIGNTFNGDVGGATVLGVESDGGSVYGNTFAGASTYAALELWGSGNALVGPGDVKNVFTGFTGAVDIRTAQDDINLGNATGANSVTAQDFPSGAQAIDLTGSGAADTLTGNSAANVITGGAGNDTVDAEGGTDTFMLPKSWSSYTITRTGTTYTIVDDLTGETDTVSDVENFNFNGTVISVVGNPDAILNQPPNPEPAGLNFDMELGSTAFPLALEDADLPSDPDGDPITYTVAALPTAGTVLLNGVALTGAQTLTQAQIKSLTYTAPTVDTGPGTENYTLQFTYTDGFSPSQPLTIQLNVTDGVSSTLTGDGNANRLDGAALNDTLNGQAGNDTLIGGGGNDAINGGADNDTAVFSGALSDYLFNHLANGNIEVIDQRGGSPDGTDTLNAVEQMTFSNGTFATGLFTEGSDIATLPTAGGTFDALGGNDTARYAAGTTGMVTFNGGAGTDTFSFELFGSAVAVDLASTGVEARLRSNGNNLADLTNVESVIGTTLADQLYGSAGDNRLVGGRGSDTMSGRAGNDTLEGQNGSDTLNGGAGNDTLNGGLGADTLNGGADFDVATYATATGGVRVFLASPGSNTGEAAGDTHVAIEGLIGSAFNDYLGGDGSANTLTGGAGNDRLNGGQGNDTLQGDAGADRFIFGGQFGSDVVLDFNGAEGDLVDLRALNLPDFAAVQAAATDDGADVVISFGANQTFRLNGLNEADLQSSYFLLS